jgi:hypothetical protein
MNQYHAYNKRWANNQGLRLESAGRLDGENVEPIDGAAISGSRDLLSTSTTSRWVDTFGSSDAWCSILC